MPSIAPTLPILTFDERKLTPSFGYFFDARWHEPYESIVGVLWKFARMNGLAGHVVVTQLCRQPVDPYLGIPATPMGVDVRGLARLFGLTQKALRAGLGRPGGPRSMSCNLRHCPRCMALGYHSVVHQLLGAMQCPAHGDWLEERCRACGQASAYRLDAQLLGAPFRCAHCRRPYGRSMPTVLRPRSLPKHLRTAITRAYLG